MTKKLAKLGSWVLTVAVPVVIAACYGVAYKFSRGGKVVDSHERIIAVRKAGLERSLYNFAHEQPLGYGIASLVLALLAISATTPVNTWSRRASTSISSSASPAQARARSRGWCSASTIRGPGES